MKVSVIIPMYNSQKTIGQTLSALENQTRKDFEIVVVDDGSTDTSSRIVKEYGEKSSLAVSLVHQPNSGAGKARNLGVQKSKGEIVVFIDSDCIPPANWLEVMIKPLNNGIAGCTCGYQVKNKESLIARYIDYEIAQRHQKLIGKTTNAVGSYSLSLFKDSFHKAGGFDTSYTAANAEDFALAFKMSKMGYNILFTGDTFVYHFHPSSLRKYLRQQYTRGYWRVKMYLENRDKILRGDSYTGYEAQIQFLLTHLALISVPLMFINPYSVVIGFGLLLLSNLPLGLWTFKKEKNFLFLAPVLASLRSLAGTIGAYSYVIRKITRVNA